MYIVVNWFYANCCVNSFENTLNAIKLQRRFSHVISSFLSNSLYCEHENIIREMFIVNSRTIHSLTLLSF